MADITAGMVKELRETTGAGMMDCKRALEETSGNIAEAQKWHKKLFPLCRDMLGLSTNPIPIKAAMKLLGRDTGALRLPMTPLEAASEAKLRKTLTEYGLL